jgi:DNA (cytosine-5)-methyltransferase 1
LENVDRLLKSPSKQRGRDFGIMLRCFSDLGYSVEWRVINAAEYGFPQRRRRIYIFAYKNSTKYATSLKNLNPKDILIGKGIFAKAFPINGIGPDKSINILNNYPDLIALSNNFNFSFENGGLLTNNVIFTAKTLPATIKPITLGEIVESSVPERYYLSESEIAKFTYLRGSKKIQRTAPNGSTYMYSEGSMPPFDDLRLPGRTMLTSEGTINRSTHIIYDSESNRFRILTPIECERLNEFPDNWTNTGMPDKRRYFTMGNALVCGIVKKMGMEISIIMEKEE